jgi:hypothetical protein
MNARVLRSVLIPERKRFVSILANASHIFLLCDNDRPADRPMSQSVAFSFPALRNKVSVAIERHSGVVEVRTWSAEVCTVHQSRRLERVPTQIYAIRAAALWRFDLKASILATAAIPCDALACLPADTISVLDTRKCSRLSVLVLVLAVRFTQHQVNYRSAAEPRVRGLLERRWRVHARRL